MSFHLKGHTPARTSTPHPKNLLLAHIMARQALKTLTNCKSMLGICPNLQQTCKNRSRVCTVPFISVRYMMLFTTWEEWESQHRNPPPLRSRSSVCAINMFTPCSQSNSCACPREQPETLSFPVIKSVFIFQNLP